MATSCININLPEATTQFSSVQDGEEAADSSSRAQAMHGN